jgi:hypothetical protein
MPKTTDPLFTLVYVEDNKPVTLEFRDLVSLERHVQAQGIKPSDEKYRLLVDGREATWDTRLSIHIDMPQPSLDAKPVKTRKPRRTKEQMMEARANEAKKKNGAAEVVS